MIPMNKWISPLALLLLCLLSHGLLVTGLGFYWDDWPFMWVNHSLEPKAMVEYFYDRPLFGHIYAVVAPLLGVTPFPWHVATLFMMWIAGMGVWLFSTLVWPDRRTAAFMISAMFVVYPGFLLQPTAVTTLSMLTPLAIAIISLLLMVLSIKQKKGQHLLLGASLISQGLHMTLVEYYVGLELLRPLILWQVNRTQDRQDRIQRVFRQWLPYLALLIIYLVWRLAFFDTQRSASDQKVILHLFIQDPLGQSLSRLGHVYSDVWNAVVFAWFNVTNYQLFDFASKSTFLAWAAGISAFSIILMVYQWTISSDKKWKERESLGEPLRGIMYTGFVALLVGMAPVWFIGGNIDFSSSLSRYALPAMLGATMLIVGILFLVICKHRNAVIVSGIFVGLAVAAHVKNANNYRHEWEDNKRLYWQLAWRAPSLEEGTMILLDNDIPQTMASDYSYAAPINLMYAPDLHSTEQRYWVSRIRRNYLAIDKWIATGDKVGSGIRTLRFNGSVNKLLVVWNAPPSCVRVFGPNGDDIPRLHDLVESARRYSNINVVKARGMAPATPPVKIFGPEPIHDWCYYFEKADLARQQGEWANIGIFYEEVKLKGLSPHDVTEWGPFLDAFVHLGRAKEITEIKHRACAVDLFHRPLFCRAG